MYELNKKPVNEIDFRAIAFGEPTPKVSDEMLAYFEAAGIPLNNPVQIREFEDLVEFRKDLNNFWLYLDFSDPESSNFMEKVYTTPPWARRFRIAYPTEFNKLNTELKDYTIYSKGLDGKVIIDDGGEILKIKGYKPTSRGHDEELIPKFYGAYKIMSHLVDKDDPSAYDANGQLIKDILLK